MGCLFLTLFLLTGGQMCSGQENGWTWDEEQDQEANEGGSK